MHERRWPATPERGPEGRGNPAPGGGSLRWAGWFAVTANEQPTAEAKGGGGRKRLREVLARPGQINVRVSDRERAALTARAAELGVTIPRLMVEAALEGDGPEIRAERLKLARELNRTRAQVATVANNVNQLARVANTTGELPEASRLVQARADVAGLVAELRAVSRALTFPTGARREVEETER